MSGPILQTESHGFSGLLRCVMVLGIAVSIDGCATGTSSGTGRRAAADAERLERFRAATGEPVPSFRLMRLTDFTPLGEHHLVVARQDRESLDVKPRDDGEGAAQDSGAT